MFQSGNISRRTRNLIDTKGGRENHSPLPALFLNLDLKSLPRLRPEAPAPYFNL
jgi:hypothetical protein